MSNVTAKKFFNGEWYKDGVKQLCADGWPTFIVPVNIKVMELLEENSKIEVELAELRERCAEYEKILKSIDTDTEIDEQGREWQMDKDDMRIASRNVLAKYKGDKKSDAGKILRDDEC